MSVWQSASGLLAYAIPVLVKATVLLCTAWLLAWVLRRRPAAERHLVWAVAMAGAVALPVLGSAFPSWRVPVPPAVVGLWAPAGAVEATAGEGVRSADAAAPARPEASRAREVSRPRGRASGSGARAPGGAATEPAIAGSATAVDGTSPRDTSAGAAGSVAAAASSAAPVAGSSAAPDAASPQPLPRARLALLVWLAGALLIGGHMLLGLVRVRGLRRRTRELSDHALRWRARRLAAELGVRKPVTFLEGDADSMPMTFGVFGTCLLLPSTAGSWSPARQDAVLRHELAHVRRRDSLTRLVGGICCAIYWFHPVAWLAARRLRVESEHACDDVVLVAGARPSDYAAELLAVARTIRAPRWAEPAVLAMARPSSLRTRIVAVLEERPRAGRLPAKRLVPALIVALAGIAALSAMSPASAADRSQNGAPLAVASQGYSRWGPVAVNGMQAMVPPPDSPAIAGAFIHDGPAPAASARIELRWPVGSPAEPRSGSHWPAAAPAGPRSGSRWPAAAPAAPHPLQPAQCFLDHARGRFAGTIRMDVESGHATIQGAGPNGGDRIIQQQVDGVTVCLRTRGDVELLEDRTGIASIGAGGLVVIASRSEAGTHALEITRGPAGMEHTWYVNGAARPFDDTVRQWRDVMLEVLGGAWEIGRLRGRELGLRGQIASVRGQESSLRGEIASIRGRELSLRGQTASTRGQEASLRGQIASIRGQETSMRGQIASIRGQETSMRGEISSLRARISSLESARRTGQDAETRAHLDAEIGALRGSIDALERRIAEYDAESRVAEVERLIAGYDAARRIRQVEEQIQALDTDARVQEIEREIQAVDTDARIRQVEARLARLDVAGEVARIEREIEQLAAERRIREVEARMEPQVRRLHEILRRLS